MAMWCAIRTYAAHADELGNPRQTTPIFFTKPDACLSTEDTIDVSGHDGEIHHEVELVLRLDHAGAVSHVAVGLDLTDRAAQRESRPEGLPWARGKAFRGAARVGAFAPWDQDSAVLTSSGLHLELRIDGDVRQSSPVEAMSIPPSQLLADLQAWAPLTDGDMVFTGTPPGVGPLRPGQALEAVLRDANHAVLSRLDLRCV
ncbi:MAG: fumarylacetoacetate hydrolase family protein [Candidatus Poseidoniaceae archaeon]